MISVLRQGNFGLLWFAGLTSMIGDWVLFIALPIYTYNLTQSSLAMGIMFMAGTLPRILVGSVAGVFVDRWDRKRTMVLADLSRAVLLLFLLLVRSPEWIWIIYVVAFCSQPSPNSLARLKMPCSPHWSTPRNSSLQIR